MTTTTANIAAKFNVLETAVIRVEEWANVMFCVVKGLGARFVSKKLKVEEVEMETKLDRAEAIVKELGYGKTWVGGEHVRVYFGKGYLEVLSNDIDCRKMNHAPAYYRLQDAGLLAVANKFVAAAEKPSHRRTSCLNCGITNTILVGRGYCTDCHGECN
jgi:hypothetical protein